MNVKYLLGLVVVLGVAGCRDPGAGSDEIHADRSHRAEAEASQVQVGEPTGLTRPLPGGVAGPSFPYHVSIDRDTGRTRNGHPVREVGIEFLGATPVEAELQLTELIQEKGGSIERRQEADSGLRVVYLLRDGTHMLAWYRQGPPPGDRYALKRQDATGTLYLAWPYNNEVAR